MEWFIAVIAVAALGVAAIAAAGGMGQMSKDPVQDTYRQDLPDRQLVAADLDQLRFGIALRGYAMGQVDDVLDRLGREIAARDARIDELMGLYTPVTAGPPQLTDSPLPTDSPLATDSPRPAASPQLTDTPLPTDSPRPTELPRPLDPPDPLEGDITHAPVREQP
jgi:DivIVA domain-containing protein